jgi:hypothetical protein
MEQLEHPVGRKNTKISFRTDEATFAKLKAICRIENKTVSSLIESLLTEHVLGYEASLPVPDEKRQSPRKKCSIPVVISTHDESGRVYGNGVIVNFSAGAMQIILSEALDENTLDNEFHALFTLPTRALPLLLPCRIIRTDYRHGEYIAIATLHHSGEDEVQSIEAFLCATDRFERQ